MYNYYDEVLFSNFDLYNTMQYIIIWKLNIDLFVTCFPNTAQLI